MKKLLVMMLCGSVLFGCQSNSIEPIEDDVLVDATEGDLAEQERQQRIEQTRREDMENAKQREQQRLLELQDKDIEQELDKLINDIVTNFLENSPLGANSNTDSLEEYYLITGHHITENQEHYNKLKEAYWNSLQEQGLCNNQFWNDNNDDCINKPDEAFARVEAYVNGSLDKALAEENKNRVDENASQYAVQQPQEESYLDIVSKIRGEKIEEGLTYDNFLLVGTVDFNSVKTINELFGFKGELVSEYGTHTIYQWVSRDGLKIVTVSFENGVAVSKTQVGL